RGGVLAQHLWPGRCLAQLEILGDELDVDEAAAAVLYLPRRWGAVLLCDAVAHVGHLDDEAVAVARPQEDVAHAGHDLVAKCGRPANDTRAGQRHLLPCPGELGMVAAEGGKARGERALGSRWPESHIDLIEAALRRDRRDRIDETLAEPRKIRRNRQRPLAVGQLDTVGRVINDDQ